jgi:hypothetical protein
LIHELLKENFATDYLAKLENSTSWNLVIQQDTSYDISLILFADVLGATVIHLSLIFLF